jgi:protein tyrosine/serine phosphatase
MIKRRFYLFLCAVLISGAGICSGKGKTTPDNSFSGLKNFAKISGSLSRGAQPDQQGFRELKKRGFRTIVNLRANHSDAGLIKGLGFKYVQIPCNTWDVNDRDVVKFLKIATNPSNQPVFVHCEHGSDRTGTMVAVYRIYSQSWSIEDAMDELPQFGFHEIWQNLRVYLKKIDVKKLKQKVENPSPPGKK